MKKAKDVLGEDARLLGARRVSPAGSPPVYEVRVTAGPPAPTAIEPPAGPPVSEGLGDLRQELDSLRETILTLENRDSISRKSGPMTEEEEEDPRVSKWLEALRRQGVSGSLARKIVETASRSAGDDGEMFEALGRVIADQFGRTRIGEELGERSTVFVGPTGAGKTTVLSRIASQLARRDERPVLVSADGDSLAGEENLQAVAAALGLRFETAFLEGQLEDLVERIGPGETFLVDTPGRAPFERDAVATLRTLIRSIPDAEVLLVLPSTIDVEEARLLLEGYSALGVDRVVFTKLDELYRPGRIVDLAKAVHRPIAAITFGRGVRGTSSAPSDPRVVSRILGTSLSVETSA